MQGFDDIFRLFYKSAQNLYSEVRVVYHHSGSRSRLCVYIHDLGGLYALLVMKKDHNGLK